jgi:hypothetical protein
MEAILDNPGDNVLIRQCSNCRVWLTYIWRKRNVVNASCGFAEVGGSQYSLVCPNCKIKVADFHHPGWPEIRLNPRWYGVCESYIANPMTQDSLRKCPSCGRPALNGSYRARPGNPTLGTAVAVIGFSVAWMENESRYTVECRHCRAKLADLRHPEYPYTEI